MLCVNTCGDTITQMPRHRPPRQVGQSGPFVAVIGCYAQSKLKKSPKSKALTSPASVFNLAGHSSPSVPESRGDEAAVVERGEIRDVRTSTLL